MAIVGDKGGGVAKHDFARDDAPFAIVPSIVEQPKRLGIRVGDEDSYVGDEACATAAVESLGRGSRAAERRSQICYPPRRLRF